MTIFSEKEQSLLSSLDDEVLVLDLSYKILYANDKFLEKREKSLSEVRGKTCYQFFHNSDKPCQKNNKICPLKEVLGNSKPIRTINQEGERYLGVYASPLKDKKGSVIGLIKLFKDITETEREKKMSEDKYKDIIEKSHDAIAIIQDGKIKLSNQKLVDLFGYSREELNESDFMEGIAPEHSEMVLDRHRKRLNGEQVPDHYELAVITKSGQRKDVEMNVLLVEYKGRIGTCCFMRDITEKKKNETQIRELKDYLNNIINTSQVAITVIDDEGNFSIFNQGAERLLGYKAEEVIGKKNVSDFYADKEKYVYMKRKLLKEGLIENFETYLIKKDGNQIPICISVSQLKGQHGETIGSIEISTDLSERKKVEKALRESEIRLNAVVNNTPNVAIESFDIDGKILYLNKAAEEMFGWTSAEILGKTMGQLSANKGVTEEFLSILRDIDKSNKSYGPSEWKCKNKKGMPLTVYSTIFPIPSTGGKKEFICMDVDVTERKKAEELLQENEEKFRNLAEQSPNMIFINKNGRVVYANQKCEEIMGYKRDEFYAQDFNYLKLIAPECSDSINENFIKHMKGEEVQPLEYTLVSQKGEKVEAILITKLITYEGEKAILGTITDITQRKKIEEKIIRTNVELSALNAIATIVNQSLNLDVILQESLDKVLEVTGSLAGGIYIINQHSKKLELKTSKGLCRETVKGIDDLQWGEGFSGGIVITGEPVQVEDITQDSRLTRIIMKKTGLHSFLGVPLKSKGKILGTLFIHSPKKKSYNPEEVQLLSSMGNQIGIAVENANLFKEAEQWIVQLDVIRNITNRLNRLNDVKTVALAVMDEIKKVIDFDNCRVFLLDENRDELIPIAFGSEVKEYQGETEETLRLKIGEGISGWVAQTGEPQIIDDGEKHPRSQHVSGTPYVDESIIISPMVYEGEVRGVISLSKLGLKQFNRNHLSLLNILANEAAVAIENAKLFENLKQAYAKLKDAQEHIIQSEKLRALGEMAGGVAHDFNNLLGAILGRAQLLLLSSGDEKIKKNLKVIEKAALDGAETVRRIQEFTRQKVDENFTLLDLNEILKASLEITKHRWKDEAQKKGVLIQVEIPLNKDLPLVAGNPSELREVFVNIILNAIDAMPEGGKLSINSESNKENVITTISDTGIGMPEEVKRRVFDPFFTTKGPKGNGLGMSVAYGIIVRHNGKILIESQVGKGTTFKVKLPKRKPDDGIASQEIDLNKKRIENILVIDDDPVISDLISDILKSEGHRVKIVESSLKGVELFEKEGFGIVFTDLSMPEMSGWEVAGKLKSINPAVVVVMVTGWDTQEDNKKLNAFCADLLLSKPFEVQKLLEVLKQAQRLKREKENRKVEMANSKS